MMRWALVVLGTVCSATVEGQSSLFDSLYARRDTAVITLTTQWKKLLRNKYEKTYQAAAIEIDGLPLAGRIRSRGNARLKVCRFPSLKIKLAKATLEEAGYDREMNDLKLVMQCADRAYGEGYLRREKLVYELHAIVSPFHHRTVAVRLVVAPGDTLRAFVIESEEQLTQRYDAVLIESDRVSSRGLDRPSYLNMCLFNYLILNTDWNVYNLHNLECINPTGTTRYIPIPYDFDYSGLVGTTYAQPHDKHGQESVYEAKWIGRHVTESELIEVGASYLPFEEALLSTVENTADLKEVERRRILERIREFYKLLRNEEQLVRILD